MRADARPEAANPGMHSEVVDLQHTGKLKDFVSNVGAKYPKLNVLINMAGISKAEALNQAPDYDAIDSAIAANLTATRLDESPAGYSLAGCSPPGRLRVTNRGSFWRQFE